MLKNKIAFTMDSENNEFFEDMRRTNGNMNLLQHLEQKWINVVGSIQEKLRKQNQDQNSTAIDVLHDELVRARAKLQMVTTEIEALLQKNDENLRRETIPKTTGKKECVMEQYPDLGSLFKCTAPVNLTNGDDDHFHVECVKNVYSRHIEFRFKVHNTLDDQQLEDLTIQMDNLPEGFQIIHYAACPVIEPNKSGTTATIIRLSNNSSCLIGCLSCIIKYKIIDFDPVANEFDDEQEEAYGDECVVGNVEVTPSDHIRKMLKLNWSTSWEEMATETELKHIYSLSISTLKECVNKIINLTGMQPCERSDRVPEGQTSHTLYLAGIYRGGHDVLIHAQMDLEGTSADYATTRATIVQLTMRSTDKLAVQVIASVMKHINKQ